LREIVGEKVSEYETNGNYREFYETVYSSSKPKTSSSQKVGLNDDKNRGLTDDEDRDLNLALNEAGYPADWDL
jgi:hypothetical protein